MVVIVSACLFGVNCRYDGLNNYNQELVNRLHGYKICLVCPEQLGGLNTPRPACEIQNGSGAQVLVNSVPVLSINGDETTVSFLIGAYETLSIAKKVKARHAIFKEKSPSCGVAAIYDGSFSGKLRKGNGVCTEMLRLSSIKVISADQFITKGGFD